MCGIIAATAPAGRDIVGLLIEGLKRLEYRGYDSAGLAVLDADKRPGLTRLRSVGRVARLESRVRGVTAGTGIAHTRWATHGAPSERNAHPHVSGDVAVVHNGIIENHEALRAELSARGYAFRSDTDTEVIAHLIHAARNVPGSPGLAAAVGAAVQRLEGAFAIAVVDARAPGRVVVARNGSPLLLGIGPGLLLAASDASALLATTRQVVHLEDGDLAELHPEGWQVARFDGTPVDRPLQDAGADAGASDLGPYRYYMQKEIFEQPAALARTMAQGGDDLRPERFGPEAAKWLSGVDAVLILACGTSAHAALTARYWLEELAGLPCTVEIASEYRYRTSVPRPSQLVVALSQSGETADTLAALRHARALGQPRTLAICNVAESALVRECALNFITQAGPEIGVASTKAFTTQLAALFLLTLTLARLQGRLAAEAGRAQLRALSALPGAMHTVLEQEDRVAAWAQRFAARQHALFLGRGPHYPIAMEGALKLKEISYIHAEAYAAGELKHGPLALVDHAMPVLAVAPNDRLLAKVKSNLEEVQARGGELYVLADADSAVQASGRVHVLRLPGQQGHLSPLLHVLPLQLLAYHAALARGTDVDKPRNLAKSVTVE